MDHDAIQHALSGPIASVRTPFNKDGSVDYKSLQRCIDFDVEGGSRALLLTYGDSLFSLLSDQDIADVTKATVDAANGRAAVVACTGLWSTSQSVDFAVACKQMGADILQVFVPQWYPECLDESALLAHHAAIAAEIPVMANSAELQRGNQAMALRLTTKLVDEVPNIIAMKADCEGDFDRKITSWVKDHWTVYSGGKKSFHLELLPYGCQGYLSAFCTFRPSVSNAYWQAIGANDMAAATAIINNIDRPFFEYIIAAPGGFDAAIHGVLELEGLAQRWRRAPFYSLTDTEMEQLGDFMAGLPTVDSL